MSESANVTHPVTRPADEAVATGVCTTSMSCSLELMRISISPAGFPPSMIVTISSDVINGSWSCSEMMTVVPPAEGPVLGSTTPVGQLYVNLKWSAI